MQGTDIRRIFNYEYDKGNLIGNSRYGSIYRGINSETGKKVVIKVVLKKFEDKIDDYEKVALFFELQIRVSIKSKNLAEVLDVFQTKRYYYIVMELCDGDIRSMIGNQGMAEKEAKEILKQITSGCIALSKEGICHGYLRPSEILFTKNPETIKVGDYLIEDRIFQDKVEVINENFKKYLALQVLKGENATQKSDIWSLGCIYYELLHGHCIIEEKNQHKIIQAIENKKFRPFKKNISQESKDFITKCLEPVAEKRASWDEVLHHKIYENSFICDELPCFNKTKEVMGIVRFQVNKQNLHVYKLLNYYGYSKSSHELNIDEFERFLKVFNPTFEKEDINYIFKNFKEAENTVVPIKSILALMKENYIRFEPAFEVIPNFVEKYNISLEKKRRMAEQAEIKIRNCFRKLYGIIEKTKKNLQDIFYQNCKTKKGRLTKIQFGKMMRGLDKNLEDDEINAIFDLLDRENTRTILFVDLNKYYSRVNGIPERLNKRYDEEEIESLSDNNDESTGGHSSNVTGNINQLKQQKISFDDWSLFNKN